MSMHGEADWVHNDRAAQWELRSGDIVAMVVTDELISRTDRQAMAVHLHNKYGRKAVPPPLRRLLPAPSAVIWGYVRAS